LSRCDYHRVAQGHCANCPAWRWNYDLNRRYCARRSYDQIDVAVALAMQAPLLGDLKQPLVAVP